MDHSTEHSVTLSHLLVSEAIREFEKTFEGNQEKSAPIESHIFNLGKKPGFAIVGLMCKSGQDFTGIEDCAKFLANKLSPVVLNQPTGFYPQADKQLFTIVFKGANLPKWFTCLNGQTNPQQQLWIKAYAQFYKGVYLGALTHMGFSAKASYEINSNQIIYKFEEVKDLDHSIPWENAISNM